MPKAKPKRFLHRHCLPRDDGQRGGRASERADLSGRWFVRWPARLPACLGASSAPPQRRRSFDRWPIWGVKKERRDRERDSRDSPNGASGGGGIAGQWRRRSSSVRVGTERRGTTAVSTASILARLIGEPVALAREVAWPPAAGRISRGITTWRSDSDLAAKMKMRAELDWRMNLWGVVCLYVVGACAS